VSVAKVDSLVNLVGELVITEAMLAQSARAFDYDVQGRFAEALAALERNTRNLQEAILGIRMIPMSFVFSRLPRMARDVARGSARTSSSRSTARRPSSTSASSSRSPTLSCTWCATPSTTGSKRPRRASRTESPRAATCVSALATRAAWSVITVADDGAGLDRRRILAKRRRSRHRRRRGASDADVWKLVFAPGFSTSAEVTDVSGRGVGMDVVRRNVEALGGAVEIDSLAGQGADADDPPAPRRSRSSTGCRSRWTAKCTSCRSPTSSSRCARPKAR
jgi:two-component system chemotaxis sensor kinase CheA